MLAWTTEPLWIWTSLGEFMNVDNNRKKIYIAVLTALQIILEKYFGIKTLVIEISLSFLPLAVTAVLFGTVPAGISAGIADILGFVLFPVGTFFPGFTLSAVLSGMIYGYSFYKRKIVVFRIAGTCLIVSVFISLFLNTYWLYVLTGKSIEVLLPLRILTNMIMLPIKIYMIWILFKSIRSKNI